MTKGLILVIFTCVNGKRKSIHLSSELQATLQVVSIFYMLIERKVIIDQEFSGANRALKSIIKQHENIYWNVEKGHYQTTRQGELLWENWRARWWDFIVNYDIYSAVDLKTGAFANFGDDLETIDEYGRLVWEDLRLAVCMRKLEISKQQNKATSLDPFAIAFLGLLSQGRLDQSREWQFDIAFDSIFWNEIENVVNASLWPEDLSYQGVSYETVVDDIILKGLEQAKQRWDQSESFENHFGETLYTPSYGFESEDDVLEEYEGDLESTQSQYYCYQPYWTWTNTVGAIGAIGLCWTLV